MNKSEKLAIGKWYLKQCECGWSGGPPREWQRPNLTPRQLENAAYAFIHTQICPTCNERAEEAYHTDSDWDPIHLYTNGKHHHFECINKHHWCPFGKE